jgi:16S rRNA (adenine1518-N6/adenine1519-N6)-dimethyltransferase
VAGIAQLVRASVCGTECRRFEPGYSPHLFFMNKIFAKKSLGQNFLTNPKISERIASILPIENNVIIEVGPGRGALTEKILLHNPTLLIAIEKDMDLYCFVKEKFCEYKNFIVINADAQLIKLSQILQGQQCSIIANLPYNVGTRIILNWAEEVECIKSIVVMLQKEVVDRLSAKESTKDYGRISVMMQSIFKVKKEFDVSGENFYPKPKVKSSVVSLVRKESRITKKQYNSLDCFCKIFFAKRRKTIGKILKDNKNNNFTIRSDFLSKRIEQLKVEEIVELSCNSD